MFRVTPQHLIWLLVLVVFSVTLWMLLRKVAEGYTNQRMKFAQNRRMEDGEEDDTEEGWQYNAGEGVGKHWQADDFEFSTKLVMDEETLAKAKQLP